MRKRSFRFNIIVLTVILLMTMVFSVSTGSADLSFADSFRIVMAKLPWLGRYFGNAGFAAKYEVIVWKVRMPRIAMAALVGASLSVVGATFQGIFRNPLADPHILGVSSGAAFGATIGMLCGFVIGPLAFVGAVLTVFLVYNISRLGGRISVTGMLLTGTAISTFLSSIISLLMTFNNDQISKVYMWTMGSFSSASWTKVEFLAIFVFIGASVLLLYSPKLNIIMMGDDEAKCLGIEVDKVRRHMIIAASLLVAAAVSVCGIVGFVGMIIPHCMRLIFGADNRKLMPYSFFAGAIFVTLCDTVARTVAAPTEIPVGIITSLFGAPYFIVLVAKGRKRGLEL